MIWKEYYINLPDSQLIKKNWMPGKKEDYIAEYSVLAMISSCVSLIKLVK